MINNVLTCHRWDETNGIYNCICPKCGTVNDQVGNEPFECPECSIEFILDEKRGLNIEFCQNCIHYTFTEGLIFPNVCLECIDSESNSKFQAKDDPEGIWETLSE